MLPSRGLSGENAALMTWYRLNGGWLLMAFFGGGWLLKAFYLAQW